MIPEHRLATLLDQVKQNQISKCYYHNPTSSLSLFADHACDRSQFPLQSIIHLSQNSEVWFLEFSHGGSRLATSGYDSAVTIYDTLTFKETHSLAAHTKHVAYVAWSPDDSRLVSCSHDGTARLWDTEVRPMPARLFFFVPCSLPFSFFTGNGNTDLQRLQSGKSLTVIQNFAEPVTTAAWTPDGQHFVTGSLDKKAALTLWSAAGAKAHAWAAPYRVQDLAVSPDGARLVTVSVERQIFVYDLAARTEEYSLRLRTEMTCVSISRDSRHMLVNMADNELQLIDLRTAEIVQRFMGQKQGRYVIRSAFGGADENLVISGSEGMQAIRSAYENPSLTGAPADGKIYIFHRERGTIIETLEGHQGGCVNSVAWNPSDPCMWASAGDDKKVRMYAADPLKPMPHPARPLTISGRWSKPNPVHRMTPASSISSLRRNPSNYSSSATFL